jgi:type 1 fimbriae regulatory protein FimB/type 1 fimbriae regulatory protein FimE
VGADRLRRRHAARAAGEARHAGDPPHFRRRAARLGRLKREQDPFVFTSERYAPFHTAGFARVVERARGGRPSSASRRTHTLRHACGYALANKGHDARILQAYLGHKSIQHTVRCTELSLTE